MPATVDAVTREPRPIPTQKVAAGGIAGAVTSILLFAVNTYFPVNGEPLPAEIGAAITTLISFIVSYMVPPAAREAVG